MQTLLGHSDINFNPPSPCGEGHANHPVCRPAPWYFNPPSPCGEGLDAVKCLVFLVPDFNPPSPCGEGLEVQILENKNSDISIHPPRVGRDSTPWQIGLEN